MGVTFTPHPQESLESLVAELRADREAAKAKERSESWLRYASIAVILTAVLTAIAAQWATKYTTRTLAQLSDSTFYQVKASDGWAYYQAKSIKQNLYEVERDLMVGRAPQPGSTEAQLVEGFGAKAAKYEREKAEIKAEAERLEGHREEARRRADVFARKNGNMNDAVVVFQVAIALYSIAMLSRRRHLWYLAMAVAAAATVQMIHTWTI